MMNRIKKMTASVVIASILVTLCFPGMLMKAYAGTQTELQILGAGDGVLHTVSLSNGNLGFIYVKNGKYSGPYGYKVVTKDGDPVFDITFGNEYKNFYPFALDSGKTLLIYREDFDTTYTDGNLKYVTIDESGNLGASALLLYSYYMGYPRGVARLSNGGFAVFYHVNDGQAVNDYAVDFYGSNMNLKKTLTFDDAPNQSDIKTKFVVANNNNRVMIVHVYDNGASFKAELFDNDGNEIRNNVATSTANLQVAALTNGNFAVLSGNPGATMTLGIYDNSGNIVGNPISVGPFLSAGSSNLWYDPLLLSKPDGGFILYDFDGSNFKGKVKEFNNELVAPGDWQDVDDQSTLKYGYAPLIGNGSGYGFYNWANGTIVLHGTTAKAAATVSVTATPNPALAGGAVTLTSTVSSASGTPTGTVTFTEGATVLGTATLAGNSASLTTSALSAGTHTITATYSGDSSFNSSANTVEVLVNNAAQTPPALTADSTENDTTHAIEITFTEDAAWRGAITAVKDGGTALPTGDYSTTSAGTIRINAGVLSAGTHTIAVSATGYADASVTQSVTATGPTITSQPSDRTVTIGQTATFQVAASGDAPLSYQWKKAGSDLTDGGNISGAITATLSIVSAEPGDAGSYTVVVTNAGGTATSQAATLTVNPKAPPALTADGTENDTTHAIEITFTEDAAWRGAITAVKDGGTALPAGDYSTTSAGTIRINAGVLSAGTHTITVAATGYADASVTQSVTATGPTITSQPSDRTVTIGQTATFQVAASGDAPLSYQWKKAGNDLIDGGNISGATTATLSIVSAEPGDAGSYTVAVTNAGGTATSQAATLTVNPKAPPALTADGTENDTTHAIEITFTEDAAWRGAITAVKDGGTALQAGDYSTTSAGTIRINAGVLSAGTHTIAVSATGYADASVTQSVNLQDRPANPANLLAAAGNRVVDLRWDTVTGATYYNVYMSEVPHVFDDAAFVTVTEAAYQAQNRTNGTTYYFVVKAGNPGGLSAASNEVSATPATVPAAPTHVAATAGNGSVTLTFTAPTNNGGSDITGYEVLNADRERVAISPANVSSITVTGLINGRTYTFTVAAKNAIGSSDPSAPSNAVTPVAQSHGNDSPSTSPPSKPEPAEKTVDVLVNGKVESAGSAKTDEVNGQQVTTIMVDEQKLMKRLEAESAGAVLTIPISTDSDVVIGELNGRMIKNIEKKQGVVELRTDKATYTLPAHLVDIDAISERFGAMLSLQDIKVKIEIAVPHTDTLRVVADAANREGLTLVLPPLNFKVSAVYGNRTEEVAHFNAYVERTVAIPEGIDPKRITTGVVVEPDGTVRHVPTKLVEMNGQYFAKINSLTNSTYSVVWHPLEFKDMANHWAKASVNNMGSRMVVKGAGNGMFIPDRDITRAEFAAIMVRGLGLRLENGNTAFTDVSQGDWFSSAVKTAYEYKLIQGFEDGTFRPNDKITREQAMHIIANAMNLTGLSLQLKDMQAEAVLQLYDDAEGIGSWAVSSLAKCVQAGIVSGRSSSKLAPNDFITRAEVASIIERLLEKSELI